MKKELKVTSILITLNIIVLIAIISFYTFRLIKYYKLEHGSKSENETVLLTDELIKKQSYVDLTKGLVYDEKNNNYRYKGDVKDNYLLYSGILFRIIGIDNENNIKIISEDNQTLLYTGLESEFDNSIINKWLNKSDENYSGIFENNLYNSDKLLEYTYLCNDKIDDLTNITCNDYYTNSKITLLSLYDYKEAEGKSSYLNNGKEFALSTVNSENNNYFVNSEGDISIYNKTTASNIRPVLTLSSNTELLKGNGEYDNPYIVEEHEIKTLNDVYVGNIIKYNNQLFKVININDKNIKVASLELLKEDNENVEINFDKNSSEYSKENNMYKYLNDTYYKTLENQDYIVSSDFYQGKLSLDNLDYTNIYEDKVNANIGLLTLGDLYINEIDNTFTLFRGIEADNIINVIKDNNFFADIVSSKYNIRVAFYLDRNLNITSGKGTTKDPYILGDKNED